MERPHRIPSFTWPESGQRHSQPTVSVPRADVPRKLSAPYTITVENSRVLMLVHGYLDAASGTLCCEEIATAFDRGSATALIVDIGGMTGYSRVTRRAFQSLLLYRRSKVQEITLITTNPLFRMASSAVCICAGIKMKFADSIEEASSRLAA